MREHQRRFGRLLTGLLCFVLLLSVVMLPGANSARAAVSQTSDRSQPALSQAEPEAVPVYAHNLRRGSRGQSVRNLQWNLKTLGFYHSRVTGQYGSITAVAVRRFQSAYSLRVDGIVGPVTRTAIAHAMVKRKIVHDSTRYLRKPYIWGSSNPRRGFDCSGFIYYMFRSHGVYHPRYTSKQLYHHGRYVPRHKLQPGDLVFFALEHHGVSHVGFYMGHNKFISATSSKGIWIYTMSNHYWAPHYVGARRPY